MKRHAGSYPDDVPDGNHSNRDLGLWSSHCKRQSRKISLFGIVLEFDPGGQDSQSFLSSSIRNCSFNWAEIPVSMQIKTEIKPILIDAPPDSSLDQITFGDEITFIFNNNATEAFLYKFRTLQFVTNKSVLMIARPMIADRRQSTDAAIGEMLKARVKKWAIALSNGDEPCP